MTPDISRLVLMGAPNYKHVMDIVLHNLIVTSLYLGPHRHFPCPVVYFQHIAIKDSIFASSNLVFETIHACTWCLLILFHIQPLPLSHTLSVSSSTPQIFNVYENYLCLQGRIGGMHLIVHWTQGTFILSGS